jgi:hypothetical protein
VVLFLSVSYCQICNPANGTRFNPACTDTEIPYCRQITTGIWECRECQSDCDCSRNQFCSSLGADLGVCKDFDKYGDECLPYNTIQLANPNITAEMKCAELLDFGNGTIRIGKQGFCIERKCRFCDFTNEENAECGPTDGLGEERQCTYPGTTINTHQQAWNVNYYKENPSATWFAIFFFFTLIVLVLQSITLVARCKGGGGGGGSKSHASSHASSAAHLSSKTDTKSQDDNQSITTHVSHLSTKSDGSNNNTKSAEVDDYTAPPAYKPENTNTIQLTEVK